MKEFASAYNDVHNMYHNAAVATFNSIVDLDHQECVNPMWRESLSFFDFPYNQDIWKFCQECGKVWTLHDNGTFGGDHSWCKNFN